MMKTVIEWFQTKRVGLRHLFADILIMTATVVFAILLRVGPEGISEHLNRLPELIPLILIIRLSVMVVMGCYAIMWRYISTADAVRLVQATGISTAVIMALTFLAPDSLVRLPRSVYLIDSLLVVLGLMGARLLRRLLYEGRAVKQTRAGKRTLVYGAGQNGRHLVQRFRADASSGLHIVGFIDDDPLKMDLIIGGVPVLGNKMTLSQVISRFQITEVIVAIPQIQGVFLRDLVMATRPFNIRPRVTSRLDVGIEEKRGRDVEIVRDINLADLLNHPPRQMNLESVGSLLRGKCILITGAGGSIGSELCRQIVNYDPRRVLLLDHSEFNLYEIDRELRLATHDTERVVPLLVDLKDHNSVQHIIKQYAPDVVFHAAAYKHVHLVENNPHPAILNNVEGTRVLLKACETGQVKHFLMISTDKAVNPAGVMGSTKRVCELMVTACARRTGFNYCSVRFGNVLGSSGSLIPLLQQQIQSGGPVTVTHPDMTRFFMLIPEAVALVLKALSLSRPGDISVLRMGEPIRIADVAKSLIALMGKTEEEIPIVYTGIRPGEKLFEELYIRGDELETEDPDILTLKNGDTDGSDAEFKELEKKIEQMVTSARAANSEDIQILNSIVKSNGAGRLKADESRDSGQLMSLLRNH